MSRSPWFFYHYLALGSLAAINTPYPFNTAYPLTVAAIHALGNQLRLER